MTRILDILRMGILAYPAALFLQQALAERRVAGVIPDTLVLLEHPPTITLGLKGKMEHLRVSGDELARLGIDIHRVDRGGDITFHGPGQLVGYPVLHLDSLGIKVRDYVRMLEEVLLRALKKADLTGKRLISFSGVWVGDRKLAAIGIHVTGEGISRHGFALNIHTDLGFFNYIHPCGLKDRQVTSMEKELGERIPMDRVRASIEDAFVEVFEYEKRIVL